MPNSTSIAGQLAVTLVSDGKTRKRVFASVSLKRVLLCIFDILLVNVALFSALILRDLGLPQIDPTTKLATEHFTVGRHLLGFNILHAVWLFVLYSVGLYDIERFASRAELVKRIFFGVVFCGVIGLAIFYITDYFDVTPKVFRMPPRSALALDLTFLALFLYLSRELLVRWGGDRLCIRVMLCGNGVEVSDFKTFLDRNGRFVYKVTDWVRVETRDREELARMQEQIQQELLGGEIDIIAVTRDMNDNEQMRTFFYRLLCSGTHVSDFTHLYEEVTGKIPSSLINEGWFVGSLRAFNRRGFELAKRMVDLAAAIVLGVPTLLFFPAVALAIRLESPGPIIFRQKRVGRDGRVFNMVKFRTMFVTDKVGFQWAADAESRITRVGRLLRRTRIDELPQLWNVLKGEMSFVGPRPEWTELYAELIRSIPFYEARTLVRPGLTGWAQINFGYGASVEDDKEKLKYDLYYIKYRSIVLDLSILLKTVATVLRYEGR